MTSLRGRQVLLAEGRGNPGARHDRRAPDNVREITEQHPDQRGLFIKGMKPYHIQAKLSLRTSWADPMKCAFHTEMFDHFGHRQANYSNCGQTPSHCTKCTQWKYKSGHSFTRILSSLTKPTRKHSQTISRSRTSPQQEETQFSQTAPQDNQEHMFPCQQQNFNWSQISPSDPDTHPQPLQPRQLTAVGVAKLIGGATCHAPHVTGLSQSQVTSPPVNIRAWVARSNQP